MSKKLLDALKVDYLEFPDQDALNTVCNGRILGLPPVYNGIRTFFLPQYKRNFLSHYSQEDWDKVQSSATIHYTGGKPWNMFTVKFNEWWNEYDRLPKSIKDKTTVNKKMLRIHNLTKSKIGNALVNFGLNTYRKLKYKD